MFFFGNKLIKEIKNNDNSSHYQFYLIYLQYFNNTKASYLHLCKYCLKCDANKLSLTIHKETLD